MTASSKQKTVQRKYFDKDIADSLKVLEYIHKHPGLNGPELGRVLGNLWRPETQNCLSGKIQWLSFEVGVGFRRTSKGGWYPAGKVAEIIQKLEEALK